ncbi:acyltransferase [Leuconostoc citreum]|uniref:acyltransferase n=1 Tax=Leuconostoc citreum TaxID=33964 RepID=UPI0021A3D0B7|nr:acyltransferase [Leuconostoc citreum]MCT3057816.1 acyltransferase [Leuconostoc citreum]MCT3073635.1 acyltransferase [Leuconostoc citreum]MDM7641793.1 acyltransferase [Leuconostoc citreum]
MFIYRVYSYFKSKIWRLILLKQYKGSLFLGPNIHWRSGFSIIIENTGKLTIEENCLFNFDCSITCLGKITIGKSTIFGENVKIYDHNHRFNQKNTRISDQGMSIGEVNIGSNCWIGSNSVILKGTTIGDNCVIGAGAIISENIPSNTILRTSNNYQIEKITFRD